MTGPGYVGRHPPTVVWLDAGLALMAAARAQMARFDRRAKPRNVVDLAAERAKRKGQA